MQIKLSEEERRALFLCARHERREMREQAAFILRQELQRRGLLDDTAITGGQHGQQ